MGARADFSSGVREVRVLLALSAPEPSGGADGTATALSRQNAPGESDEAAGRANAAMRASVVLLVAHFESYLKSVALEFVDYLSTGSIESRAIPAELRDLHTMRAVRHIHESGSLQERTAHFKKLSQVAVLWNDDAKPSPGTLRAELLAREVTSAKPDKIDRLFKLMGGSGQVCDGDIDVTLPIFGLSTLNIRRGVLDVVDCRDDIAHGDSNRKPTSQDVERYVTLLEALADRLDRKASELKARIVISRASANTAVHDGS